jgi:hypothetical protein
VLWYYLAGSPANYVLSVAFAARYNNRSRGIALERITALYQRTTQGHA